jgi:hypothetical protein
MIYQSGLTLCATTGLDRSYFYILSEGRALSAS